MGSDKPTTQHLRLNFLIRMASGAELDKGVAGDDSARRAMRETLAVMILHHRFGDYESGCMDNACFGQTAESYTFLAPPPPPPFLASIDLRSTSWKISLMAWGA